MAEQMTIEQIEAQEKFNSGTSPTKNSKFDRDGYLFVPDLYDPKELYRPVPDERGLINYWGKRAEQFNYDPLERQVEGSIATYWHPQYRSIHSQIRLKLEKIIGCQLYNTYYYDRFYFPGQELKIHCDRPACEISVSIHVSSTISNPWLLWIKTCNGEHHGVDLSPGDGLIYKGCERPHWRNPLPVEYQRTWYGKRTFKEGTYYHQIFFHYVLANGKRSHHAFDR